MKGHTISDELIVNGFQKFDARITKEYFYGYCRNAYRIFDHRYQLRDKMALDFYSLAHDYYIQLLQHDFRQLTDRPAGIPLATWMTGGFRYVVLEALKAYNMEFRALVDTTADEVAEYVRSEESTSHFLYDVVEAVSEHYHDRTMQEIAHMVLFEGYKQKEVAQHLGITPAAVNQRYKKMMDEVVTPYVVANYGQVNFCDKSCATEVLEPMETTYVSPYLDVHHGIGDYGDTEPNICLSNNEYMQNDRITPECITVLLPNEIFVFGSNLQGIHAGGAARMARLHFGAVMGQGIGLQGKSYAIPTMQGGVDTIRPYVEEFIAFAQAHPQLHILVTPIGCGIAGFDPEDIAPLFASAIDLRNICLPLSFWEILR